MRGCDRRPEPARARGILLMLLAIVLANPTLAATQPAAGAPGTQRMIIVAIADKIDPTPQAGSSPRGYSSLPNYSGSDRTRAESARLARDYALREVSAWTIDVLRLRCMLLEIPAGADRARLLERLQDDRRVRLAQTLQEFETLSGPTDDAANRSAVTVTGYNDPYVSLQSGFSAIDAALAQRWTEGADVEIALIDTGVDATHPDLAGRIRTQRDFVADAAEAPMLDRHGTEVAGVIAAVANNGVGIVGVAPGTHVLSYRACWPVEPNASAARCNSYTLALALGAAISARAQVINLSLGGPHDLLLEQLLAYALAQGAIVVGAVPPDARTHGFPLDVPGVIAVRTESDAASDRPALVAPGREILTLEPGGHYDYVSGSSLAAAHVTGTIALLLQLRPRLDARALFALLSGSARGAHGLIDACSAVRTLTGEPDDCRRAGAALTKTGSTAPAVGSRTAVPTPSP